MDSTIVPRPTLRESAVTASVLLPLLAVTAAMRLVNLIGAPQRVDDEGTYVAQAYAMLHLGSLTHYTYWYDHPPLGWLQIAGWLALSEWVGPVDDTVAAGRRFMVVVAVVTAALLWVLVRRLGYGRVAAGAAVAIMALSPLAVQYQRMVYLDNLATVWVLAAAVCLCTPRRRLAAYMGAGACFAVAVLSKETALLLLPALVWLGWQRGNPGTRRYAMAVAGTVFGLLVFAYVLAAAVRSELIPGPGHVSLIDGITFQLISRTSSGSVFTADSPNQTTVSGWIQLDGVLLAAGVVAGLVGVAVRVLRPLAFGLLLLVAMVLRGGYLPIPYVIAMIPLSALLVATVAAEAATRLRNGNNGARVVAVAVLAAVATAGVIAQPRWRDTLDFLTTVDRDAPVRDAEQWVLDNVPRTDRLVVDDVFWANLVTAGWNRNDVGWFYKLDTDPAVQALSPHGWRDYDYIISTSAVRQFPATFPQIHGALTASVPVATFGVGSERVEVRRIDPNAAGDAPPAATEPERVTVGAALAQRLGPDATPAAADLLRAGRVDARVLATLSDLSTEQPVKLVDVPAEPGEDAAGRPRRQALLAATDEQTARIVKWFRAQRGPFAIQNVTSGPDGVLVSFSPATPSGLLAAAVKPPAPGKPAAVRVLNLVPGSGPQRVRLSGLDGTAVAPVPVGPYGDIGKYFTVPAGVATMSIGSADPATPTALSQTLAFNPGGIYTLMVFAAANGGMAGQLVPDPGVPGPGIRGVVRLAHADDRAPNLTVDVEGVGPLAKNVSYGLVTGYAELAPGNVAITLTSGTARTTTTVPLRARDVRTLVVLDGPDGPRLVVVTDPARPPVAVPLAITPAARPGVLAPPPPPSATADASPITAPLAASGRPLGQAPLGVLAFGLLAAGVGALLRRRNRGMASGAATTPEPAPHSDEVTVVVRRVKAVLGRVPRPPRAVNDPDRTQLVEEIEGMRWAAARAGGARIPQPPMATDPGVQRGGADRRAARPLGAIPAGWCQPGSPIASRPPAPLPVTSPIGSESDVSTGTTIPRQQVREVIRSAHPARLGPTAPASAWVTAGSPYEGPTVTLPGAPSALLEQRNVQFDGTERFEDLAAIRREVERRRAEYLNGQDNA